MTVWMVCKKQESARSKTDAQELLENMAEGDGLNHFKAVVWVMEGTIPWFGKHL